MSGESFVYLLESLTKTLVYSGTFIGIGTCTFRWLLLPHLKSQNLISLELRQKTIRVGLGAAWLTILALFLRAWAHTVAAFGFEESLILENLYPKNKADVLGQDISLNDLKNLSGLKDFYSYGSGFFSTESIPPELMQKLKASRKATRNKMKYTNNSRGQGLGQAKKL